MTMKDMYTVSRVWFKVAEGSGGFETQHTALEPGPCHVADDH